SGGHHLRQVCLRLHRGLLDRGRQGYPPDQRCNPYRQWPGCDAPRLDDRQRFQARHRHWQLRQGRPVGARRRRPAAPAHGPHDGRRDPGLMSLIVILTGAGVSAESGVDTFRDQGGIWSRYDLREVATPEGFAANPTLVHEFYNDRREQMKAVEPNAAHRALALLEHQYKGEVLTITQNIDDLHERAGTKNLIHMHGELSKVFCIRCSNRLAWDGALS